MSEYSTENEEFDNFSEKQESDNYDIAEDEEPDDYWSNEANSSDYTFGDREQVLEEAAIALIKELTTIRIALNDRQQLTNSFSQLNSSVAEQQQQIQTIISLLEQLTQSLSADKLSKFLQIQKSFGTFAQKLEMFEKGINSNIRQNQESREKTDEIYQNLNLGWRQLAEDNKIYRRAIIEISSLKNIVILSISVGLSAAGFMLLAFKLFIAK